MPSFGRIMYFLLWNWGRVGKSGGTWAFGDQKRKCMLTPMGVIAEDLQVHLQQTECNPQQYLR